MVPFQRAERPVKCANDWPTLPNLSEAAIHVRILHSSQHFPTLKFLQSCMTNETKFILKKSDNLAEEITIDFNYTCLRADAINGINKFS